MVEQSLFLFLGVIVIWGVLSPDMILGFVGDWLEEHLPEKIKPAIFSCPFCMTFWYSWPLYIWRYGIGENMPYCVIMAMGWSLIFVKFLPENWNQK